MNTKKIIVIILAFISFRCGDEIPDGVVDVVNENLHVISLAVPADSVYNNPDKPLYISFRVNNPQALKSAYYNLESPEGINVFSNQAILDIKDDLTGDDSTGDGIYSGRIPLDTTYLNGSYKLDIFLENIQGGIFKAAGNSFFYFNGKANYEPKLSDLSAPDTIRLNNTDYRLFMSIKVEDGNGLSDIKRVYFTSYRPDNSIVFTYELKDDGNTTASGDETAGDGIYSITINIIASQTTTPATRRFEFKAEDRLDAISEPINHFITITE